MEKEIKKAIDDRCAICKYWKKSNIHGNFKNGTCVKIDFIYSKDNKNHKIDVQIPRWGLCDNFETKHGN